MGEEGKNVTKWLNSKDWCVVNCSNNNDTDELTDGSVSNSDDDVKWDECAGEVRCLFDQVLRVLLRGVYSKNGIRPIPPLLGNGLPVDLFKLFCLVRVRGGYCSVSKNNQWGWVSEKLGFDFELSTSVKLVYYKYLDELDQWLSRISSNESNECGGSLSLLSIELERRLSDFHINRKASLVVPKDENSVDYVVDSGKENNGVNTCDTIDRDDLCGSHKRKRDVVVEMVSWLNRVAKNPRDPCIGVVAGSSAEDGNSRKEFGSVALLLREARLHRRNGDLNNEQLYSQKKQRMHPSMYEDNEGLRCSRRLLSLVKSSPTPKTPPENTHNQQQNLKTEPQTETTSNSPTIDSLPFEKHVPVGPDFQAEVPVWAGPIPDTDPKWLGTHRWSYEPKVHNPCPEFDHPGRGRTGYYCNCSFPGSVECCRFHIAERRMKLRRELGLTFYHWRFDRMGEEVSLSWSSDEEKIFKQMIRVNRLSCGKSFFPKKTWVEVVGYYYNVFQIKRRSYQNRVTPKEIDSDDDESDFGSVSQPFGYKAVMVPEMNGMTCSLNEQVSCLD